MWDNSRGQQSVPVAPIVADVAVCRKEGISALRQALVPAFLVFFLHNQLK